MFVKENPDRKKKKKKKDVNKVCFEEEQVPLIRLKNQEKVKALRNGVNVGNEAQCTQMLSALVL